MVYVFEEEVCKEEVDFQQEGYRAINIDIPVDSVTKKRECIDRDYRTKGNQIIGNLCITQLPECSIIAQFYSKSQIPRLFQWKVSGIFKKHI